MGILTKQSNGEWVDGTAQLVADEIRQGKPTVGWRGHPDLELRQGVLKLPNGITGRRWEVWYYTPDGEEVMIGHWKLHELDQIVLDLVQMDPRNRNRLSTIEQIDKENAKKEKEASDQIKDSLGQLTDHYLRLLHDRTEGPNTFRGFPGANFDETEDE